MRPDEFTIVHAELLHSELVTVTGEIDLATSPTVAVQLEALADPVRPIILDLTAVTFIDSSGLHAIALGGKRGRVLVICPPNSNTRRVFDITQLAVELHPTVDAALETLAA
jgi:anti-sigma B factor antagonist